MSLLCKTKNLWDVPPSVLILNYLQISLLQVYGIWLKCLIFSKEPTKNFGILEALVSFYELTISEKQI